MVIDRDLRRKIPPITVIDGLSENTSKESRWITFDQIGLQKDLSVSVDHWQPK